jgi:NitT/TauT family transport system substrate-binding protein
MKIRVAASMGDYSALCAYFLSSRGIKEPRDLAGKKVGVDPFDQGRVFFPLLASSNGFRASDVTFLSMPSAERTAALASGSVDAILAPISENRALRRAIGADALSHFLWADFSFIPYGRCIFVREGAVADKPGAIRAFLTAAFKAWDLALRDPDQAAAALGKYRVVPGNLSRELSGMIEDLLPLFDTDAYRTKGIGYLDPARMEATLKAAVDLQSIPLRLGTTEIMSASLLPNPPVKMPARRAPPQATAPAAGP